MKLRITSYYFFNTQLLIVSTLLVFVFSSCRHSLKEQKLADYISNPRHGLKQEKLIKGTQITLVYRPADLMAWQEIQSTDSVTKEMVREVRKRYNGQYYFLLSVSPQGREILSSAVNRAWFSEMVSRLSFGMEEYVSMVNETQDTLRLITYSCPRMYGMSPSTDMLFVFEKKHLKPNDILTLKLEEFGLLTGDVKFRIKVRDISNAPGLRELNKLD